MSKIAVALIVKNDTEADILKRALSTVYKYVDGIFITATNYPYKKIEKYVKNIGGHFSLTSPATTPDVYTIRTSEDDYKFLRLRFPDEFKKDNRTYESWKKKVVEGLKKNNSKEVSKDVWLTAKFSNFAAARNFNFQQVPREYEWIFWMDTDDVVIGAETFRQAIEVAEKNNIKAVFARYLYQVELDDKGNIKNILIEHLRERLIRNDGTFEWVAPIHETLIEKVPAGKTDFQGFTVVHLISPEEMYNSMYRNIEILEEEVIRNPNDPRPIYYLAKAYFDTKIPEILYEPAGPGVDSITVELIKDYLRKSGWAEERAQALEYLSMIYRERNQIKEAIEALLQSLIEDPKFTSAYIQLALCYVIQKDWSKALHWVKLAGNVEIPKTTLVINPRDYKSMILEALFHIYLNTGQLELCQKVIHSLADLLPTDLNKKRVEDVDDLKAKNDIAHWVVKLAYHLKATKQEEKLVNLVNAIPIEIANEPVLVNLRNEFLPAREWGNDEVAIFCGPGFEKWSPKNLKQGIGGSEEAVIYLSRELAKRGWKVTVFADPQEDAGVYDGVNYVPYYQINWKDKFNMFISWRQIGLFDIPELKANKTFLWNHDIANPLEYTPERVNKIDKIMFLSKWHRDNVPDLDESKVMYTANGINI